MKRGCTQCGECLNVCPVYALFKREEYAPKGKRLLMEPLDAEYGDAATAQLSWERVRQLARLCAGCGRCQRVCARKLSTSELLADARARNPHWTQNLWEIWIRRAGPLWPLAGKIAMLAPDAAVPEGLRSSLATARALVDLPAIKPWLILTPTQKKPGTPVVLFSGCTAVNARPRWIAKARELLATWGYQVLDSSGFTCCGGTLHHAGRYKAQDEVRQKNIQVWRDLGRPLVASFCASCKHSLDEYAAVLPEDEAAQWKEKCRGLSALLEQPRLHATADAPTAVAYHQPCHWGTADPDLPLLQQGLPELKKGAGLCCGMGGILKMSNPDLSMDMARKCLEGFAPEARHVITGCSGCVMQLSSVATAKNKEVRHWLDIVAVEAGA
ncbi:(Fe-S)-binding protein [Desulfovibrio legallii]|uniref:(Fe-S)-binding protein n=1 Tax=Desulfovibrio legallii TaxID=571438 RepID=A0A6H3F513_9BACT|nr:(Fe-S)-binding protein [Desulfovibrio legallii]RHH26043.1 (Fe-S)-binding protein [Desulfovibrio sp. AM18-2]TBH79691.1 (Fe-S)-binding protein [Desulfovibrio legallii]CAI3222612.1 hypothetical protein DWUX_475 [Desulfovibrio diazotrophicus]